MPITKIGEKVTNSVNCSLTKLDIFWHVRLISKCKKTNFTSKQYFFDLLLSVNVKETLNILKCFYSAWKEKAHKPSKVVAAKNFLFSAYVIGTTCFDKCFLLCIITATHHYCYAYHCSMTFLSAMFLLSLTQVLRKKSVF